MTANDLQHALGESCGIPRAVRGTSGVGVERIESVSPVKRKAILTRSTVWKRDTHLHTLPKGQLQAAKGTKIMQ